MRRRKNIGLLAILLLVAVLFIPSYIAIATYQKIENTPPDVSEATEMTVSDLGGNEFCFTKESGADMLTLLSRMISEAEVVSALPEPLRASEFYNVGISFGTSDVRYYRFYFSMTSDTYIEDSNAKAYRVSRELVADFLTRGCASSLYNASATPVMSSDSGLVIAPAELNWKYRLADTSFVTLPQEVVSGVVSDKNKPVDSDGSFRFTFSNQPDYVTATIYDGTMVLYSGPFSGLSGTLQVTENTVLHAEITANWYEDAERSYQGSASYSFDVNLSAPASFRLGADTVLRGGVVMLTAYNAADSSAIEFTSSPALTSGGKEIKPVFYSNGTTSRALIMIDYTTEVTEYEFTVTYGAVTESFKLSVGDRTYRTGYTSTVSAAIAESTHSQAAILAFSNVIRGLLGETGKTALWEGLFVESVDPDNTSYALGFGHSRTIASTEETYQNEVVDYNIALGDSIFAAANGKVLYTGVMDYPGKFAVVDHGMGLFTIYMHLSEYSVSVGDTVTAGQVIGKAGDTGFIASPGAYHSVMYTVDGNPFCGYELWEDGIPER